MGVARILIDIAVRAGDAAGDIDRAASSADKFKSSMGAMAGPAAVAVGAIGGIAAGAISAASDMQQASGGVDAVFKGSAATVHEWAKTSADSVGLAGAAYKQLAAGVGGAMTGMGVPLEAATQQTGDLITRAADLASVYGGTTQQAVEAMTSAYRGEYDSLQRLIPGISDAAVKQEMAAQAAAGQTFATEEAAKASAIYATIMGKSTDAAGNFAKEADTTAGAQERAKAKFIDTAAALGEQLLPAVTTMMTYLTAFGTWVSEHIPLVTTLGAVIGGLALAVLAINGAMAVAAAAESAAAIATGLWSAAAGIGTIATTAFATAMAVLTSPITLVVVAIAALIAIIVLLVKNWDTVAQAAGTAWEFIKAAAGSALDWIKSAAAAVVDFLRSAWSALGDFLSGLWDKIKQAAQVAWEAVKIIALAPILALKAAWDTWGSGVIAIWEKVKSVGVAIWSAIQSAAQTALGAIMAPINAVKAAIEKVISLIKSALSFAGSLLSKVPFIGGLFGGSRSAGPTPGLAGRYWSAAKGGTPSVAGRGLLSARSAVASGGGVNITVTGALDPVGVARQIRALLVAEDRRQGFTRV